MKSSFLIAAPSSGSGKTTVARGLMALLTRKGYRVQPFKCGPDYIDTKFHAAVCGRPSVNLDTFMASPAHVRELFDRYGADADVCVAEGMMGLFDGYDRDRGSCYEIARELDLPVVLVVDARSAAYSMAALLQGFLHFRQDVHFTGVIFNKVGSGRHAAMLRQVCDELGLACLGCLPKETALEQGSRYLGLDFSQQVAATQLASLMEQHIAWQQIIVNSDSERCGNGTEGSRNAWKHCPLPHPRRVLVARNDESFSFLYQETLDCFGQVTFFDPEHDMPGFDDIDLLYLPGGYPEKHLEALVANEPCRKAIRAFAGAGGHIVAECGGMMYLCERIVTDDGCFPMCGVLPYAITARKADRRLSLGYRQFTLDGREYRGHEFHYTQFLGETPRSVAQVCDAKGQPVATPVLKYKNVLASYTHLYAR